MVSRNTGPLEAIASHGVLGRSDLCSVARVKPARISFNSEAETLGCWSGASRAIRYQTAPAATPIAALSQNDARQPRCALMAAKMGGVSPAPAPTPAKIHPLARPRSSAGIHRATNWFETG